MFDLFEGILGQEHMTTYLRSALDTGQVTHAYLLCGAADSGVAQIALRFAAGIIANGDQEQYAVALRGTHPDLHQLEPSSAVGYLVEQVREVVHDAGLAPVRAPRKVYVVNKVETMRGAPANAFLKTLEEPPADVVIIMLATNEQSVLQTIRSRCQVLTCAAPTTREEGSFELVEMVSHVAQGADNRAVLAYAKRFVEIASAGVEELKEEQEAQEAASADYLSAGARKELAETHKRQVSMQQRQQLLKGLGAFRGWLRDCLLVSQGAPELAVGTAALPRLQVKCIMQALEAVDSAEKRISYNVTPQLAIEACLIEIREALCLQ